MIHNPGGDDCILGRGAHPTYIPYIKGHPFYRSPSFPPCRCNRKGCRVVVLNGRNFPSFQAGDQGRVIRVDKEALNCEVPRNHGGGRNHGNLLSLPETNSQSTWKNGWLGGDPFLLGW